MTKLRSNLITVGRATGVFGVKGWLKIKSYTEEETNILGYSPWWLKTRHGIKEVEVDAHRCREQGLVVHIKGVDDRDAAALYTLADIAVDLDQLPHLDAEDYYWHQLIGLKVISEFDGAEHDFGIVDSLMQTGANDVISVKPDAASLDETTRLIPYIPDVYVKKVDLERGEIRVEWDPDF